MTGTIMKVKIIYFCIGHKNLIFLNIFYANWKQLHIYHKCQIKINLFIGQIETILIYFNFNQSKLKKFNFCKLIPSMDALHIVYKIINLYICMYSEVFIMIKKTI